MWRIGWAWVESVGMCVQKTEIEIRHVLVVCEC